MISVLLLLYSTLHPVLSDPANSLDCLDSSNNFNGAVSVFDNVLYYYTSNKDRDVLQKVAVQEKSSPLHKIKQKLKGGTEHDFSDLMFRIFGPKEARYYETIHILTSPLGENSFLHFYLFPNRSNVIFFTEKITKDKFLTQDVAPQNFFEITFAIHALSNYMFLFVYYDTTIFALRTGTFGIRKAYRDVDFHDVEIILVDDLRPITFNEKTKMVRIHPVGKTEIQDPSLLTFFKNTPQKLQAFYHNDFIYVYPTKSVKPDDRILIFRSVPALDSYDPEDSFDSPYITITWEEFWIAQNHEVFVTFPHQEVVVLAPSRTYKFMITFLVIFVAVIMVCFVGQLTGVFDFKSGDRRTYFADEFIRKIQGKEKVKKRKKTKNMSRSKQT